MRKVQRGAPLHDDHSGGARAAMLWVCRLGIPGDEARVRELEGLPKRLAWWWVGGGWWGGVSRLGWGWEWGLEWGLELGMGLGLGLGSGVKGLGSGV